MKWSRTAPTATSGSAHCARRARAAADYGVDAAYDAFVHATTPSDIEPVDPRRVRTLTWRRQLPVPPEVAWSHFLAELWIGGAGFGPRPEIVERGDDHGTGCTRRIGPGARGVLERIVATDHPHHLEYRVMNPSWRTFPVDHHAGTVAFAATGGGSEVRWRVDLVPKRGAGLVVDVATRFVIGRYLVALERACARAGA